MGTCMHCWFMFFAISHKVLVILIIVHVLQTHRFSVCVGGVGGCHLEWQKQTSLYGST